MVLEALNVGMLMMNRSPEEVVEKAIMAFVTHYGLLGLMTALPTTPSFMEYEAVYLPKNHFIKEESMETNDYHALFYIFSTRILHGSPDCLSCEHGHSSMGIPGAFRHSPVFGSGG